MVPVNDPVEEMLRDVRDQIDRVGYAVLVEQSWPALRSCQHAIANAVGREFAFTLSLEHDGTVRLFVKLKPEVFK